MRISKELVEVNSSVALLCFKYETIVNTDNAKMWEHIEQIAIPKIMKSYVIENLTEQPEIREARKTYKMLGKDPSRYRVSSEALLRRILQGKGLYKVNNVVDCNNLISIETALPCGSYDMEKVRGDLVFRIGKVGESYEGIGKELINVENLPVFADSSGAFGSPTADSKRTMITENTTKVITVLISFSGADIFKKHADMMQKCLVELLGAKNIERTIIRSEI